jgi:adenylylsulfate kinase-like enzyme
VQSGSPVSVDRIPVLWLCGPPGVGKTTIGWEIFRRLTTAGIDTGYVDIDQLGICYPEPRSDPGRYRMKERNLGLLVANFRRAGARCIVVSGVVETTKAIDTEQLPQAVLTVCRLTTSTDELKERSYRSGAASSELQAVLRYAEAMDRSDFADVSIDSTGLAVDEVGRRVLERSGGWPRLPAQTGPPDIGPAQPTPDVSDVEGPSGPVLWLCGTTGVGKSSVGWQVLEITRRAGITTGFVDLEQIGFYRPVPATDPDNHRVKADNLGTIWRTFRASGAQCLVVVGSINDQAAVKQYIDSVPESAVTLFRLDAGRDELTRRTLLRGQGRGWRSPGDPLVGQPTATLLRIADEATSNADALHRMAIGDMSVDTDRRTIEEVAGAILSRIDGWPVRR